LLFHSLSDYQLFQEYPASWSKKETWIRKHYWSLWVNP
jgi:hypothetical protein